MATEKDKQIQKLFDIVQKQKAEIKSAERPSWKTNCSFGYDENSSSRINLQTVNDVKVLVGILAFLRMKADYYEQAAKDMEIDSKFKWMGFSVSSWEEDLKTRSNKIQIGAKKAKLEIVEKKLDSMISPEMKDQMELDAIEEFLGKS